MASLCPFAPLASFYTLKNKSYREEEYALYTSAPLTRPGPTLPGHPFDSHPREGNGRKGLCPTGGEVP